MNYSNIVINNSVSNCPLQLSLDELPKVVIIKETKTIYQIVKSKAGKVMLQGIKKTK